MPSDSDTEYESDNEFVPDSLDQVPETPSPANSATSAESAARDTTILGILRQHGRTVQITTSGVQEALRVLERSARDGISGDEAEAHTFNSAGLLAHILEEGVEGMSFWAVREEILNAELVDTLFKVRAQCRPAGQEAHIVTFADGLLALLFPSGGLRRAPSMAGSPAWENMQERDLLFAATCLPEKLSELPECVRDGSSSPATRRLALSLLWGCHVLWSDWKPPEDTETALEAYINHVSKEGDFNSRNSLAYAYALALFASVTDPSAFRPSTYSKMHSLLSFMIDQQSTQEDEQENNIAALDVLVRYGTFVQWAWQVWPCIQQNENVLCSLTALWMYHHYSRLGCDADWSSAFKDRAPAAIPILRASVMLKRAAPSAAPVLVPLLTAIIHSLPYLQDPSIRLDIFVSATALLVADSHSEVKTLVARLWALELGAETFALLENETISTKINECATMVAKSISKSTQKDEQDRLAKIKPLLDFLCLTAQSSNVTKLLLSHTDFVPTLSGWACGFERGPAPVEDFRAAVALLFALLTTGYNKKKMLPYDHEALHDIMLDRGPTHVLGANAYAQYSIKLVERKACTPLMRLEVWDYFVDAMHLWTHEPQIYPYADLVEVSFSLFCAALDAALRELEPGPKQFLLASERTVMLARKLKAMVKPDEGENSLLKLNKAMAKFLLDKLQAALRGSSLDEPFPIKFRLAYVQFKGQTHVVAVPVPPDP